VTSSAIVQKLWNYCNVFRDDGMSVEDLEAALEQFREIAAQEVVTRMLELAEIRNGDVLGKNRVRHTVLSRRAETLFHREVVLERHRPS